ncbi:MAG TPA: ribosome biogenesis GTPase YlqF [Desulfotomaculum sp.]|nr:ribosome biogenesis GTPase YlqF [Desulfotomaculum sp.]
MKIQWYPGHMAKAKRLIQKDLRLVDVVVEIVDARIPESSRNPLLKKILGLKPLLIVLNKADLADPAITLTWLDFLFRKGTPALAVSSVKGEGVKAVVPAVNELYQKTKDTTKKNRRLFSRSPRCIVVGIPNVGKSQFINCLIGKSVARTGKRPALTRGPQWLRVSQKQNIELLDTPGVLWPKLDDPVSAFKLAVTGAIKEEIFDVEEAAGELLTWLSQYRPQAIMQPYQLTEIPADKQLLLVQIGKKRGFLDPGGIINCHKAAVHLLREFREGALGRFTLDLLNEKK